MSPEISGKRLELLKETVPKLSRVAVFGIFRQPGPRKMEREPTGGSEHWSAASISGGAAAKDIESAFQAASKGRADAVLVLTSHTLVRRDHKQIVDLAAKNRLPAIYSRRDFVEAGGLHVLGPELNRLVPARRVLRRQDFERRQAR